MKIHTLLVLCLILMIASLAAGAQPKTFTDAERVRLAAVVVKANSDLLVLKGVEAFKQKQYVAAIAIMTKVLLLDPKNKFALEHRGAAFEYQKQYERAARDFRRAADLYPDKVYANKRAGLMLYNIGKAVEGLPYLQKANQLEPTDAWTAGYLGSSQLYAGDYQSCVQNLSLYIEKYPGAKGGATGYLQRAECYLQLGDKTAAQQDIQQASAIDQTGYGASYLDEIRKEGDQICKTTAEKAQKKSLKLEEDKKYAQAYREVWNGLKCEPQNVDLLWNRLWLETLSASTNDSARIHFQEVMKVAPNMNVNWMRKQERDFKHLILQFDDPEYYNAFTPDGWREYQANQFYAFDANGNNDRVRLQAVEDFPTADGYLKRAAASYNELSPTSNYAERLADLNRALELDPNNVEALILRARTFTSVSQAWRDPAWRDATAALKINPNLPAAYTVRGVVYYAEKNTDEALKQFDQALALDPNFEKALLNRAVVQFDLKNFAGGMDGLNKLIALNPKNGLYYRIRAAYYASDNRGTKAVEDYKQAIALSTSDFLSRIGLIKLYDQMGEKALADELHLNLYKNNTNAIRRSDIPGYASIANRNPNLMAQGDEQIRQTEIAIKQSKAVEAYTKAIAQYQAAETAYNKAVAQYNRDAKAYPDLVDKFTNSLAVANRQLGIARSAMNNLLRDYGKDLPTDLRDHAAKLAASVPGKIAERY